MLISTRGSVRVDLLGGTIDLNPINLIIPNTKTINLATSLEAKVILEDINFDGIEIHSEDYGKKETFTSKEMMLLNRNNEEAKIIFGPLLFVALIINEFKIKSNLKITLLSGSPPGAGLGGSSSMGMVLYKALSAFTKSTFDRNLGIKIVNSLEAKILDAGPAGYQDYYPAVYGGILTLASHPSGIEVIQCYKPNLATYLEKHLLLVYSNESRNSGINNWEVYKAFFNKDSAVRTGLNAIASLTNEAFDAINENNYTALISLIAKEGEERRKLFPNILTTNMKNLADDLAPHGMGIKVCGAGGGGCFLITLPHFELRETAINLIEKKNMKVLDFKIMVPHAS